MKNRGLGKTNEKGNEEKGRKVEQTVK